MPVSIVHRIFIFWLFVFSQAQPHCFMYLMASELNLCSTHITLGIFGSVLYTQIRPKASNLRVSLRIFGLLFLASEAKMFVYLTLLPWHLVSKEVAGHHWNYDVGEILKIARHPALRVVFLEFLVLLLLCIPWTREFTFSIHFNSESSEYKDRLFLLWWIWILGTPPFLG